MHNHHQWIKRASENCRVKCAKGRSRNHVKGKKVLVEKTQWKKRFTGKSAFFTVNKTTLTNTNFGRMGACLNFIEMSRRRGYAEYSGDLWIGAKKVQNFFQDLYGPPLLGRFWPYKKPECIITSFLITCFCNIFREYFLVVMHVTIHLSLGADNHIDLRLIFTDST